MPESTWFRSVKHKKTFRQRSRALIARTLHVHGEYNMMLDRPAPAPFYGPISLGRGKLCLFNGKMVRVFSCRDIGSMYKLGATTIYRWYAYGFLPMAFVERRCGKCRWPLFIEPQVRVIVKVLNDIYFQGYKTVHFDSFKEHKEMMEVGCRLVMERYDKKASRRQYRELAGKFGVMWEDTPDR